MKSLKFGLVSVPIGNFRTRPKKSRHLVKPPYCCNWEFKRTIHIDAYSAQDLLSTFFLMPPSIICCVISLKYLRRLYVSPKLWRYPEISVCKAASRSLQNRNTSDPVNLGSISAITITGAPKEDIRSIGIACATLPDVWPSFSLLPINTIIEYLEKVHRKWEKMPASIFYIIHCRWLVGGIRYM